MDDVHYFSYCFVCPSSSLFLILLDCMLVFSICQFFCLALSCSVNSFVFSLFITTSLLVIVFLVYSVLRTFLSKFEYIGFNHSTSLFYTFFFPFLPLGLKRSKYKNIQCSNIRFWPDIWIQNLMNFLQPDIPLNLNS